MPMNPVTNSNLRCHGNNIYKPDLLNNEGELKISSVRPVMLESYNADSVGEVARLYSPYSSC